LLAEVAAPEGQAKEEEASSVKDLFAVATNAFGEKHAAGDGIALLVAFGYKGDTPVRVRFDIGMVVQDTTGRKVLPTDSVEEPPPPDPSWYMEREGKQVLMLPVTVLQPNQAVAELNTDALKEWRSLGEGTYYVRAVARVRVFDEKDIVIRKNMTPRTWVEAVKDAAALERFLIRSQPVKITLVPKDDEQSDGQE